MRRHIATWNRARGVWETVEKSLLCEHSALYSETWPASGMTRGGRAYELPTSVLPTADPGSSSLLPTPTASEATGAGYTNRVNGGGRNLRTEVALLPTPLASDGEKSGPNQRGGAGDLRLASALHLLPTVRAQNGEPRNQNLWVRPLDQPQNLENALARLPGASTSPRSTDGQPSSGDQLPFPENQGPRTTSA